MNKVILIAFLMLLMTPVASAQGDDNPAIAILRFGPSEALAITEGAILDVLESYGYITADENRLLEERQNLEGESLSVYWDEAGFDLPTVNLIVDAALDRDVDVLVALNAPVAQVAVTVTSDMDDPPVVLFTAVSAPYRAGIAESSCIKPAHVGGAETLIEYEPVIEAFRLQDPELDQAGFLYATSMTSGMDAHERFTAAATEMGIEVIEAGIASLSELSAAAEGLVERGAKALFVSGDYLTAAGLPIIVFVANENGLPVFHPSMGAIFSGATVGAGFASYYVRGDNLGVILAGHLQGGIDIASTKIHIDSSNLLGINLDSAKAQDVEISADLMKQAATVVSGGTIAQASPQVLQAVARRGKVLPLEQRRETDAAFLASLDCTEEIIAEQRASLDAASE
jgi:ABC-type uncharacterized transport system substrate-binding protein